MPVYEYECERCGRREELIQSFRAPRSHSCGTACRGTMQRQVSLPAPAQGDFGTPPRTVAGTQKARSALNAERYVGDRLEGRRDSDLGTQKRALGFDPRPASDVVDRTRMDAE